jgi:hypothetical protein
VRTWTLALVLTLLGACTSSGPSASPSTATSSDASGSPASVQSYVRRCETGVYGTLGPIAHWQKSSIVVGPMALVWIRQYENVPKSWFRREPDAKVLALVKQQQLVTLTVPPSERGDVALLYEPGVHAVKDGKSQVTFQACTGGDTSWRWATQFNGGIYVAKPMCLTL